MHRTVCFLLSGLVVAASPAAGAVHRIWAADAKTAAKALLEAAPGDVFIEGKDLKTAGLFLKPSAEWCVVSRLTPDGAGAAAGIQAGDEILAVKGESVFGTSCSLLESALIFDREAEVPVRYGRAGRSFETTVRPARKTWPIGDDEDRCAAAKEASARPRDVLEIMAEAGLRCAMREYAQYLGLEKREREAARWCLKAAEAGDTLSQHQAHYRLAMGQGVGIDMARAIRFLSSAVAAGFGPSLAGMAAYRSYGASGYGIAADPAAARELLLAAGSAGTEMSALGDKFQNGANGFPKDEAAAFRWYVRSAWRGEAGRDAAKKLYEKGVVPADDAEALRFLAADGERRQDLAVAWQLLSGERGLKDAERAFRIYRRRAESGERTAQLAVGWMLVMGEGAAKDPAAAKGWFEKAKTYYSDDIARTGENNLAWLYLNGEGVDKDESKAFGLFPYEGMGAYNKGVMYEHGIWETKDLAKAYERYGRAARGDAWSMVLWGDAMLCRPACVPGVSDAPDARSAVINYRAAAEKGHPIAQQRMGELYEKGLAVTKDLRQAAIWYKRASSYRGPDPTRNSLNPAFELRVEAERVLGTHGGEDLAAMRAAAGRKAAQLMAAAAGTESYKAHDARLKSDADLPSYRLPERAEDFAVVVGVESYPNLPPAEFAERDAKAVREHFRALGVPERNLIFLGGRDASRAGLAKNLETWLPMNVKEASTVWFYFSGHGAPDPVSGDAYLVPADGDPQFLKDTAYPLKRLYEKLGALKARRVLVALDACFSGVGERSLLAKGTRPLVARVDLGGLPAKVAVQSSAEGHEVSGTLESQGHGLFTYYWLKGLNGAAAGADGAITWKGLHEWVTPRVQDEARRQNRLQTPRLLGDADGLRLR